MLLKSKIVVEHKIMDVVEQWQVSLLDSCTPTRSHHSSAIHGLVK
jgi:hypothetical protein